MLTLGGQDWVSDLNLKGNNHSLLDLATLVPLIHFMLVFWDTVGLLLWKFQLYLKFQKSLGLSISESFAVACQGKFTVPGILLVMFTPPLTTTAGNPCYLCTWLMKCRKRILHLKWIKYQLWGGQIGFSLYLGFRVLVMAAGTVDGVGFKVPF